MPNGKNRKFFLRSRKSKHTSSFSVLSFSARLFQTLGIFLQFHQTFSKFRRTFSKSRGKKNKFRGKKSEKYPLKSRERRVVLSQPTACFAVTTEFLAKTPENCDFQTL